MPEAAVSVYRLCPLVEKSSLGPVLRGVLPLDFKRHHLAASKADEKVGDVLLHFPLVKRDTVKWKVREEQEKEEVCVDPTLPRPGSYSVLQKL